MKRRVVVTGIGVVAPIGADTESFWRACLQGRTQVASIPEQWRRYASYGSEVWAPLPPVDFGRYGISRIERMQLDTATMLALSAARQALDEAGFACAVKDEKKGTFTVENLDAARGGVFMGSGVGGLTSQIAAEANHVFTPLRASLKRLRAMAAEQRSGGGLGEIADRMQSTIIMPPRFNPFIVSMTMPNACSASIGIKYGLHGPNTTHCCACAAGTVALGHAFRALRCGEVDMALAGGVEYLADSFGGIFRGFDIAKTLARGSLEPDTLNRPFDTQRSGFLFSEGGAAVLVLETLDAARARGARPIAEIRGYAETFDGHNIMMLDPEAVDIERAVRQALEDAAVGPEDIDYVNAHGTGTVLNDQVEAELIARVFGTGPLVGTTKSLVGHTIGAAGALEAAVTALSIRDQTPAAISMNPSPSFGSCVRPSHTASVPHSRNRSRSAATTRCW
jgi:3-oxoacyl-[acyl-carrier-protein] synthase II